MSAHLRALRLVNFRNYVDATALLAPGLNVVVGENAQGKTNLLEAIAFNVTGSSPRTPKENEVVRWGADFTRTEARIAVDGSAGERAVAIGYAPGQKKRITVDGVPAPSLTNYAAGGAGARVVTFFPDDIRVVKGAPSDRREFLDGLLSSLRPAYARAAVEYARAVQQRNQLLRRIRDGFSSERTLATWDRKVVELGKTILAGREAALPILEEHFKDALRALYGPEKAAIRYAHSGSPRSVLRGAQRGAQRRCRAWDDLGRAAQGRLRSLARRGEPDHLRVPGAAADRDAGARVRGEGLREGGRWGGSRSCSSTT